MAVSVVEEANYRANHLIGKIGRRNRTLQIDARPKLIGWDRTPSHHPSQKIDRPRTARGKPSTPEVLLSQPSLFVCVVAVAAADVV